MRRKTFYILLTLFIAVSARAVSQGFWYVQYSTTINELFDIQFLTKNLGWSVGAFGTVVKSTNSGGNWTKISAVNVGTSENLYNLHFVDDQKGFAVGANGIFLKTTNGGMNWTKPNPIGLPNFNFYGMYFLTGNDGWVVGENGSIRKTNNAGATWSVQDWNTSKTFYSVTRLASPQPTVYVCGTQGTINKSTNDGQLWIDVSIGVSTMLKAMYFFTSEIGYVAGYDSVWKTTNSGATWIGYSTGTYWQLNGMTFTNASIGWTIINGGLIPFTTDGGVSWSNQISPSPNVMNAISSYTSDFAWACGGGGDIIKYTKYPPEIQTDAELDFGSLLCEYDAYKTLVVKNIGQGPLQIDSANIRGPDRFEFYRSYPSTLPITLQAHDTASFVIHWKPFVLGAKNAYIEFKHNDFPRSPLQVPIIARKDSTDISLSATTLNFPQTCVGQSTDRSIELNVLGTETIQVTTIIKISGSDEFTLYAPSLPVSVAPTNHLPISIRFAPGGPGNHSAVFRVTSEPCNRELTFNVNGQGIETRMVSNPDPIYFGNIILGTPVMKTVTIQNPGPTNANITSIAISPPIAGLRLVNPPSTPLLLKPNEQRTFSVNFTPADTGTVTTELCINWDKVCAGSKCIPVMGNGIINPRIIIPPLLKFKDLICDNSILDTLKVENTGSGPLTISRIDIEGRDIANFKLIEPPVPITVEEGKSVTLLVQFSSTQPSDKGATMRLTHNDFQNNPLDIPLIGRKDVVAFNVTGDTLKAIEVCVGKVKRTSYTIENTGTLPIRINDIMTSNGNAPLVIKGVTTPFTIDPANSNIIDVEFSPTLPGNYNALFTIKGDKCGVEHILRVDAIGLKSELAPAVPINFGVVQIGGSVQKSALIKNIGNSSNEITVVFFNPPISGMTLEPPPSVPLTIDTGASKTFTIKFVPTSEGVFDTYLCFAVSKLCPDTIRIPILAQATSASLTLNRTGFNRDLPLCLAVETCDTLVISNQGSSPVTIQSLVLQQSKQTFSLIGQPVTPYIIAGGTDLRFRICSFLIDAGIDSAKLIIQNSDPKRPNIEVPIKTRRDSVGVILSSNQIDFGLLSSCDVSKSLNVTITNSGSITDTVNFQQPIDPAFQIVGALRRVIAAGASEQVQVRFTPAAFMEFITDLTLRTALCGSTRSIRLMGKKEPTSLNTAPTSLAFNDVNVGTSVTKNIQLTNNGGAQIVIEKILFTPPNDGYTSAMSLPGSIDTGKTLSLPITFTPGAVRAYPSQVCIVLSKPCSDTVCMSVNGNGVKSNLIFSVSQISFGEKAQCEYARDSVVCTNSGQASLTITSSSITGNAAAFQLLDPTVSDEVLVSGAQRIYHVTFNPALLTDGVYSASLHVETFDGQTSAIDIPLEGKRVTQLLTASALIDFGAVDIGSQRQMNISITNNGTAEYCIDRMSLPQNFTTAAALPHCIKPAEQFTFAVTFTPVDSSTQLTSISVHVNRLCIDSMSIPLRGNGRQGAIIQTAALSFGAIQNCATKLDSIFITNNGTDVVTLKSFSVNGQDSTFFSIQQPTPPTDIQPGTRLLIIVRFDPSASAPGNKRALVQTVITSQGRDEIKITQLSGEAVVPAVDISGNVFPPTSVGQSSSRQIVITNTSKIPVYIKTLTKSAGQAFTIISSTPVLPATLQPGEAVTVNMTFTPTQQGKDSCTLFLEGDIPCSYRVTQTVTAEGITQKTIAAGLSINDIHAKLDEIIGIPIMLDTDIGSANVISYAGEIQFNRTMLYPIRVKTENTLSKNMLAQMTYDHTKGAVRIDVNGGSVSAGIGKLIALECRVLLGNDVETPITISPAFDFTQGFAQVVTRTNGLFQLEGYCRARDRLMKINGIFSLTQNHPNPFNPSTKIEYEIAIDGFVSLIVHDAMGRELTRLVNEWKKTGRYEVDFNATNLPSGIYFYTLRSGRFSDVKKMVVAR